MNGALVKYNSTDVENAGRQTKNILEVQGIPFGKASLFVRRNNTDGYFKSYETENEDVTSDDYSEDGFLPMGDKDYNKIERCNFMQTISNVLKNSSYDIKRSVIDLPHPSSIGKKPKKFKPERQISRDVDMHIRQIKHKIEEYNTESKENYAPKSLLNGIPSSVRAFRNGFTAHPQPQALDNFESPHTVLDAKLGQQNPFLQPLGAFMKRN